MASKILDGIKFAFGILLVFGIIFGVVFAAGLHTPAEILDGTFIGDYIFTGDVDFSSANVSGIVSVPSGAIMAFNLVSCPSGWKAADGTSGTLDLRGQFLRGLNNFGTGARSDGNQDPDSRALGSLQQDQFEAHGLHANTPGSDARYEGEGATNNHHKWTPGGTETRPRNVAVIYCEKE